MPITKAKIIGNALLRGKHQYAFRSGEYGEVKGVYIVDPDPSVPMKPRTCFHVRFTDGAEDFVAVSDVLFGNYEFMHGYPTPTQAPAEVALELFQLRKEGDPDPKDIQDLITDLLVLQMKGSNKSHVDVIREVFSIAEQAASHAFTEFVETNHQGNQKCQRNGGK